jgi:hypothetical protein
VGIIYRPGEIPEDDAPPPAGLALGDAWFWHGDQTLLQALVDHPRVAPGHAAIRLLGFNGARLNEYIGNGAYADVIRTHLAAGPTFSEFYISGFANDALEHGLALRSDCTHAHEPAACFSPERLDLLLYHIDEGLNGIIRTLRWAYRHTALLQPVFLNGYDYPVPDGRSFVGTHGGWITAVMDAARIDPDVAFRTRVMRHLIDVVNDDVLAAFHSPLARVFHVDSRGCLATAPERYQEDWENELYPTREGFTRILERAWLPRLAPFGIAVTGT